MFNRKPLIILSVSAYDINDALFDVQHDDLQVVENEPWGAQKIKDALKYYKAFAGYYLIHFKNVLSFNSVDNIHITAAQLQTGGYVPQSGVLNVLAGTPANPDTAWYAGARTGGLHQAEFIRSLKTLGATGVPIVIYIGPTAPLWSEENESQTIQTIDKQFAQIISQTIAPYPNMHFIDFQDRVNPDLPNNLFVDRIHLTEAGAATFSTVLADTLKKDGIIK